MLTPRRRQSRKPRTGRRRSTRSACSRPPGDAEAVIARPDARAKIGSLPDAEISPDQDLSTGTEPVPRLQEPNVRRPRDRPLARRWLAPRGREVAFRRLCDSEALAGGSSEAIVAVGDVARSRTRVVPRQEVVPRGRSVGAFGCGRGALRGSSPARSGRESRRRWVRSREWRLRAPAVSPSAG
jgi:hypothetical protein